MLSAEQANIYTRTYKLNNQLDEIEQIIRSAMCQGKYQAKIPASLITEETQTILEEEGYELVFCEDYVLTSWE